MSGGYYGIKKYIPHKPTHSLSHHRAHGESCVHCPEGIQLSLSLSVILLQTPGSSMQLVCTNGAHHLFILLTEARAGNYVVLNENSFTDTWFLLSIIFPTQNFQEASWRLNWLKLFFSDSLKFNIPLLLIAFNKNMSLFSFLAIIRPRLSKGNVNKAEDMCLW